MSDQMKCPRCVRPWDGEPLEFAEDMRVCWVCGYPISPKKKNIDKIRKLDAKQLGELLSYAMIGLMFSRRSDHWFFREFSEFYKQLREVEDTSKLSVKDATIMWLEKEGKDD